MGGLIAYSGGSAQDVDSAFDLGAAVGSRAYSKDHELQADEIGTFITYYAGYDPVRGSKFFTRIPDPGDKFLGSHPPNAARIDRVNRTMARVRYGLHAIKNRLFAGISITCTISSQQFSINSMISKSSLYPISGSWVCNVA